VVKRCCLIEKKKARRGSAPGEVVTNLRKKPAAGATLGGEKSINPRSREVKIKEGVGERPLSDKEEMIPMEKKSAFPTGGKWAKKKGS